MPCYRVHRLREPLRENLRWAPPTEAEALVKLKDYAADRSVEAATPYAAWKLLASENQRLLTGDLLEVAAAGESETPTLLMVKYTGFDIARWFTPEPRTAGRSPIVTYSAQPDSTD